ncbi:MAG: alpha-glucosidase C-terminal domain-containing protein [Chloroflexi bacterium]|nr:alpha-glucosidase C-terminal domain-containing protein [Chloroflexota bacterium]
MIQHGVFDAWLADVRGRKPRALELAYALDLTLPQNADVMALRDATMALGDADVAEISADVRDLLQFAYDRYDALRDGIFQRVDFGNPSIFAFERVREGERLLIVNNLARVSQPVMFRDYVGRAGWDILNRVEFIFPTRAQLDAYEFLWLMVDGQEYHLQMERGFFPARGGGDFVFALDLSFCRRRGGSVRYGRRAGWNWSRGWSIRCSGWRVCWCEGLSCST